MKRRGKPTPFAAGGSPVQEERGGALSVEKEQTGTEEARSGLGVGEVKRRREEERVKSG